MSKVYSESKHEPEIEVIEMTMQSEIFQRKIKFKAAGIEGKLDLKAPESRIKSYKDLQMALTWKNTVILKYYIFKKR